MSGGLGGDGGGDDAALEAEEDDDVLDVGAEFGGGVDAGGEDVENFDGLRRGDEG